MAIFRQKILIWPLVALVVGLVLTAMLVQQARQWVDEQLTARLAFDAHQLAARMQQQFALQEEALRGLVGLFAASEEVSRRDFRAHVDLLKLRERFPAALEFRFARRLTPAELPAWQRQVARSLAELGEPVPDLSPKPPGPRGEYLLVEYVAPFSAASLGLDLLASPRRAAIGRLRAGQGFALSERLGDEYPDFPAYALLAALPPKGHTPLPGTVALLFRPDRLVGEMARDAKDYDIELYDAPPTAALGARNPRHFRHPCRK
jgi:CHASE1-domain containing sensor protein